MTYSIIGRCARTGCLGLGITTFSLAVGGRCEGVAANVGICKTQAFPNRTNDPLAIELLAEGLLPARSIGRQQLMAKGILPHMSRAGCAGHGRRPVGAASNSSKLEQPNKRAEPNSQANRYGWRRLTFSAFGRGIH